MKGMNLHSKDEQGRFRYPAEVVWVGGTRSKSSDLRALRLQRADEASAMMAEGTGVKVVN